MFEPIMRHIVLTVDDVSAIIHALVGYYRFQEQPMPDVAMMLLSRLVAVHGEMIQDEAQKALFRKS